MTQPTNPQQASSIPKKSSGAKWIVVIVVVAVIIIAGVVIGITYHSSSNKTPTAPITFTIGVTQGTAHIDPAIATDFTSNAAVNNLYDDLFTPANVSGHIAIVPNLATSYTVSPNGTVYTIDIRSGVLFHDNSTLTAYDVAYSFNRMLTIGQGMSSIWNGVITAGNITATNNTTVVMKLIHPWSSFVSTLDVMYVVNKNLVSAHYASGNYGPNGDYGTAWLAQHDAGSGAYTLGPYDPSTSITFQKFDRYWKGWTSDQISTAIMQTMTEEASVQSSMVSNAIDMTDYTLQPQTYNTLEKTPGIVVQNDSGFNLEMILMNCMKEPTNNTYVRQAISYAFDYATAVSKIVPGSVQAEGPVVNSLPGHNPNVLTYNFNVSKAKALLNESGYSPAKLSSFTLQVVYVNSLQWESLMAGLLQTDLSEIGLNVQIVPEPWDTMVSQTANYTTMPNFFVLSSTASWAAADYYLTRYEMKATGYTAAMFYKNQTLSNMIQEAISSTNVTQANQLYYKIQQDIAYAAPVIWIDNAVHQIAYWNYTHGYQFYGLLGFDIHFYNFHIDKTKTTSAAVTDLALLISESAIVMATIKN
ncbi:MAG: ABC transporter substrate-binding protein [Thermoplasmatales archaeon]|jgi:peptide/nickel transport system substrate-binding protein|nr:ABC transporter substrate-binding protein [Candidatus Thermoplasmatota archaeon]MDA8055376.1 ABC transporter substrate-binding protein [Thermoplasmatales archaeon]